MTRRWKYFDWPLLASVLILSLVGLTMIYSTGLSNQTESSLWLKQLVALVIGMAGLFFFSALDYRFWAKNSVWVYGFSILLLLGVLIVGTDIRGSTRWYNLGFANFQPAEFSKLALLLVLAKFLESRGMLIQKFGNVLQSFLYVIVPVGLIMAQPDLGTAGVHVGIWLGLLYLGPIPKRFFLYLLVAFLIFAVVAWQFVLAPYQKVRVESFLNPTSDPLGRGYNVLQSIVAVGSGGLTGTGLARGLQSQLRFLPERQTDFIFASTVEELGLLGGGLVLALVIFALFRMIRIMTRARDSFGAYVAGGAVFLFAGQAIINIGMNLGLFPVTGITLPFLSYGGSSIVISFWIIGILQNIHARSVPVRFG